MNIKSDMILTKNNIEFNGCALFFWHAHLHVSLILLYTFSFILLNICDNTHKNIVVTA